LKSRKKTVKEKIRAKEGTTAGTDRFRPVTAGAAAW
jgi:hypothetical protein